MEIISGLLRGLPLRAPKGMTTRPTSVRSRKALFDSLGDLSGLTVADLFAGSGAIGLEAASRGAEAVVFMDSSAAALKCVRINTEKAETLGCRTRFEIRNLALPGNPAVWKTLPRPNLVFADPPYAESMDLLSALLSNAGFTQWCSGAKLIWEMPADRGAVPPPPGWKILGIRLFGAAKFVFFQTEE